MSVAPSTDQTELYCSPEDVARFVRPRKHEDPTVETPRQFDEDTVPTDGEVIKHIEAASARIDRKTQQSWRANVVTDETHDHKGLYYWLSGQPITLQKKNIRPLDPAKGDKLEVYEGNDWNDWLDAGNMEEGRDGDYWLDAPVGILWVYERAILRPHPKYRITYRYGYDHVPADIRDAVAMKAAAEIVSGDFGGTIVPGSNQGDNSDPQRAAEGWREEFKEVCRDYKKVSFI